MNIFKKFNKTKNNEEQQTQTTSQSSSRNTLMGIMDVFSLKDNEEDLIVVGQVKGNIHVGDSVYLTNCGEDDNDRFSTTILGIETAPGVSVQEATDCNVGLRIENGKQYKVKKGTVLFSKRSTSSEIQNIYTSTLGDVFVVRQNMAISEEDLELLSIADCAEIIRLFLWFLSKSETDESEEIKKSNGMKLNHVRAALCKKIINAEEIYCIYSKITGEPHLFSRTVKKDDGSYMCMPPYVLLSTKQYERVLMVSLSEDKYEMRKIENDDERKEIMNFLGNTFYLNGACEACILGEQVRIPAQMLVAMPDYSNVEPIKVPLTNPNLMRWLLLISQLGKPENEDAQTIYNLYYRFMAKELLKSRLLIPMQHDGELPVTNENSKTTLTKNVNIKLPTMSGKNEKRAVRMYTDWKQLRKEFGEEWGGMVQSVEGMIDTFDCAINVTQSSQGGCYITKDMFEGMKKFED